MISTLFTGAAASLALIIAIGAQNAFVLRQGIRREHVGPVVLICSASDALLIAAGTAGIGALVERAPWTLEVVRWLGVAFLATYGAVALRRALHPESLTPGRAAPRTLRAVILTTVALTWLNPHVYLDTLILLGSLANQHGHEGRWWFALGGALASLAWFAALGFCARSASRWLASPRAWRIIDVLVAMTMFAVAALLALDV